MNDDSLLLAFGISLEEQMAYEFLLANPGSTAADVARDTSWSSRRAGHVLRSLETKGMASCLPERTPRYVPTSPEVALDLLTARKQNELQRARTIAGRWQSKVRRSASQEQPIELITGREAILHMFRQMHRSARQEVICLERPPYVMKPVYENFDAQKHALTRGVVLRTIVDASALDLSGRAEDLRKEVDSGNRIRILGSLPMKLVVADRRIAMIPLTLEQAGEVVLMLRPSQLLDALCELFEILWERGTPFGIAAVSVRLSEKSRRPIDADRLTSLLAAGMNDKSIAQELDISARTLERRILALMKELNARTRFQAGWQAALRTLAADDSRDRH